MTTKEIKRRAKVPELSSVAIGPHNIDAFLSRISREERSPRFIVVDLFCGAGGTSTGFQMAGNIAKVIACVNHDPFAIISHWRNHPDVAHFEEDIRTLDLAALVRLVTHYRELYPDAKLILWASLECTNFSKAKGGQARDADSRTLADHLDRYVLALDPDYVQIENVVEFMSWGPLDEKGKPVSKRSGADWLRWREMIKAHGYTDEWRELNSANFGAYTSRNRLFGIFAKHGLPIVWPVPTHAKSPVSGTLYEAPLLKWKPVKEVLDFSDEGKSIFGRKKDLADKTLERIYAGLIKYVAGGKDKFLLKYNSTSQNGRHVPPSVEGPCPTIACQNRLGVAFIQKHFSGKPEGKVTSVEQPAGTLTTTANQSLVHASFIAKYYGTGENVSGIDEPAGTITTKDRLTKVQAVWLDKQFNGSRNHQTIEQPAGALLANDKHCIVSEAFLVKKFSGSHNHQSVEDPSCTLLTNPKLNLVSCVPFLMPTSFDNTPKSIEEPCPTILASRKHICLVNPSWGGANSSADAPCPVIVASQNKAPLYMMIAAEGHCAIPVYSTDSEIMIKIKQFMLLYGIADIKMRMLKVLELMKIQGFPSTYKLAGSQSDQKKFIGNSVVPLVVMHWILAMAHEIGHCLKSA